MSLRETAPARYINRPNGVLAVVENNSTTAAAVVLDGTAPATNPGDGVAEQLNSARSLLPGLGLSEQPNFDCTSFPVCKTAGLYLFCVHARFVAAGGGVDRNVILRLVKNSPGPAFLHDEVMYYPNGSFEGTVTCVHTEQMNIGDSMQIFVIQNNATGDLVWDNTVERSRFSIIKLD